MKIRIVRATLADVELLRHFAEHTFRVAYEADNDPVYFEPYCQAAFTAEQFRNEMEHPFSSFWLAWHEAQLVGYLKLNDDNPHPDLTGSNTVQVERIYIEPALQGQKLGTQLLDFSMEYAREKQADWLWLSVWQKNPRAVSFYERCGFTIFGTDIFYVADDPQLDWAMRKPVSTSANV
jgi:diamine N-acetyltransferase